MAIRKYNGNGQFTFINCTFYQCFTFYIEVLCNPTKRKKIDADKEKSDDSK